MVHSSGLQLRKMDVGNYRFDETKETSNETKGSKSSLMNSTRCRRILRFWKIPVVGQGNLIPVTGGNTFYTDHIELRLGGNVWSAGVRVITAGFGIGSVMVQQWKRISEKRTKNQAKTDKIGHEMEKRGQAKVKKSTKSNSKSTLTKSKVKVKAKTEEMLNGSTRPYQQDLNEP
ncbi:hypothetical protein Tco_0811235 [Tanacetum coccineum]